MKTITLFILTMLSITCAAQESALQKGNSVYIQADKTDVGQSAGQELKAALQDWGYWKIASSKSDANLILQLNTKISGGIKWNSWGGKTVALSASFLSSNEQEIWQSEFYKASPNGVNGFNSQSAAVKKLVKALKSKFN